VDQGNPTITALARGRMRHLRGNTVARAVFEGLPTRYDCEDLRAPFRAVA
jgi:hypothetical protein